MHKYVFMVAVFTTVACSKKAAPPAPAGSGTGSSVTPAGSGSADGPDAGFVSGSGSGSAPGSAAATKSPPKMTPEMLFENANPEWSIEASRGVLLRVGAGAVEHLCGAKLGTAMVRFGKIRAAAKSLQADREFVDPTSCAANGDFMVCSYSHPAGDPKDDPDSAASFVFVGDASGKPVLVAVLLGEASVDASKADLAQDRRCN
jgi:hypothetical protein